MIDIVGKNYHEIVNDPTKHVMVVYYAHWCKVSKSMIDHLDGIEEKKLRNPFGKWKDLVIAKLDVSLNEVEGLDIVGYPVIKFFFKDNKEGVLYDSNTRHPDHIMQYL